MFSLIYDVLLLEITYRVLHFDVDETMSIEICANGVEIEQHHASNAIFYTLKAFQVLKEELSFDVHVLKSDHD
tara:strand:- start:193 stop:411 length:219 start_codon:yes stop_codon:yes gene_type:complete